MKFVHQVGKKIYTFVRMHGQQNVKKNIQFRRREKSHLLSGIETRLLKTSKPKTSHRNGCVVLTPWRNCSNRAPPGYKCGVLPQR